MHDWKVRTGSVPWPFITERGAVATMVDIEFQHPVRLAPCRWTESVTRMHRLAYCEAAREMLSTLGDENNHWSSMHSHQQPNCTSCAKQWHELKCSHRYCKSYLINVLLCSLLFYFLPPIGLLVLSSKHGSLGH